MKTARGCTLDEIEVSGITARLPAYWEDEILFLGQKKNCNSEEGEQNRGEKEDENERRAILVVLQVRDMIMRLRIVAENRRDQE